MLNESNFMASINPKVEGNHKEMVLEPIVHNPHSQYKKFIDDTNPRKNDTRVISSHEVIQKDVDDKSEKNIMINPKAIYLAIKRVFEDQCLQYSGGRQRLETTRIYQVWPGKNVFFFHGRFVCGPDPRGLLLTTISIIFSSWIFVVYIGKDLPNHYSSVIITISQMLTLLVLGNLILVSAIDPGIIPRNEQDSVEDVISGSNSAVTRRNKKVITINGVNVKLKYCRICKIFRPPRSCHCVVCDNCVEKFDHHCPWIGQCIALRNYRFYLTFIASALAFFVYVFSFSCWRIRHIREVKNGANLFGLLRNCPETLALVSFSFAAILLLGGLATFHLYLMTTNQTGYENFRQRFEGSKSPYDKGILSNIKEVLFVRMPPSRVDFRAQVTSKWHPTVPSTH